MFESASETVQAVRLAIATDEVDLHLESADYAFVPPDDLVCDGAHIVHEARVHARNPLVDLRGEIVHRTEFRERHPEILDRLSAVHDRGEISWLSHLEPGKEVANLHRRQRVVGWQLRRSGQRDKDEADDDNDERYEFTHGILQIWTMAGLTIPPSIMY